MRVDNVIFEALILVSWHHVPEERTVLNMIQQTNLIQSVIFEVRIEGCLVRIEARIPSILDDVVCLIIPMRM